MTTENRLAKSETSYVSKYTALQWARMAREKNLPKHEAAWMAEAKRRGEIPDHSEPRGQ